MSRPKRLTPRRTTPRRIASCRQASKKTSARENRSLPPPQHALPVFPTHALLTALSPRRRSFVTHLFLINAIDDPAKRQQVVSRAHRMGAIASVRVETMHMWND